MQIVPKWNEYVQTERTHALHFSECEEQDFDPQPDHLTNLIINMRRGKLSVIIF